MAKLSEARADEVEDITDKMRRDGKSEDAIFEWIDEQSDAKEIYAYYNEIAQALIPVKKNG